MEDALDDDDDDWVLVDDELDDDDDELDAVLLDVAEEVEVGVFVSVLVVVMVPVGAGHLTALQLHRFWISLPLAPEEVDNARSQMRTSSRPPWKPYMCAAPAQLLPKHHSVPVLKVAEVTVATFTLLCVQYRGSRN